MNIGDIKNGMRVKVISDRLYHNQSLTGRIGTVVDDRYGNVPVRLDGVTNTRSSYGYFYFDPRELEEVKSNNNDNKKENKNMTKITNYLNVAKVRFIGNTRVCSEGIANFDPDLAVNDLCVISDDGRYILAEVVEICESTGEEMMAEIVSKVYTTAYDNRVTARKAAAEIKAKMEARAKKLQDIALYQMLAKDDPEMAELLKNYQDIVQ